MAVDQSTESYGWGITILYSFVIFFIEGKNYNVR